LAVLELDGLEQGAAQSHDHRAFDLVLQVVRVDDGTAIERADGADDLHAAARTIDRDLGAGGDIAAFLETYREAGPAIATRLPAPAEGAGRRLEHRAHPIVLEVLEAELQRVEVDGMGQVVHV